MPDSGETTEQPAPQPVDGAASNEMLTVTRGGDGSLVVSGDIDLAGGPIVEERIAQVIADATDGAPVVVELANVAFIDSSGLRSLLAASRDAGERGSRLTLRHPSAGVRRLLTITGTDEQFDIEDDG